MFCRMFFRGEVYERGFTKFGKYKEAGTDVLYRCILVQSNNYILLIFEHLCTYVVTGSNSSFRFYNGVMLSIYYHPAVDLVADQPAQSLKEIVALLLPEM